MLLEHCNPLIFVAATLCGIPSILFGVLTETNVFGQLPLTIMLQVADGNGEDAEVEPLATSPAVTSLSIHPHFVHSCYGNSSDEAFVVAVQQQEAKASVLPCHPSRIVARPFVTSCEPAVLEVTPPTAHCNILNLRSWLGDCQSEPDAIGSSSEHLRHGIMHILAELCSTMSCLANGASWNVLQKVQTVQQQLSTAGWVPQSTSRLCV